MITFHHNSGFYLTTVTKGLLGSIVLSSFAFIIPLHTHRHWFEYNYSSVFENYDVLKFLGSKCVFLDIKDLVFASILIYHFRIFERKYGSRKFAGHALGAFVCTHTLELACVYLLRCLKIDAVVMPTGPYGLIFPWLVPYFCDIPRVTVAHLFGVFPFTGKSLNYILALQIAAGSPESLVLASCGIVAGLVMKFNIFWSKTVFVVPQFVAKLLSRTVGRLIESKTAIGTQLPMGATLEIQRQQQMEQLEQQLAWAQFQQGPAPRNGFFGGIFGGRNRAYDRHNRENVQAARTPPTEDNINQLVEMGFNRNSVMNALTSTNNDMSLATNVLLQES